ncbi:hypothetical protein TRIATDRAFT_134352 [Trichoderma atroviride IMI 206040]|uniref:FAD-binding domain-containing protein n=1 Tax=Hypocrea atroviridis (strain ATCC 20476 / IMI 206040) TaxID=452589 RepID=G9P5X0_HYPAI|nr:uncharacterized protein TRIATDRAFT_134352 [Trichoderma atroviride IMI 206040]EHK42316.1 hypothetical protein TRIATDRAFT_134352 [Trichoderma atroviride IMI 206040]
MSSKTLPVIIVGGGPVGLMAAHICNKLGLDFVLLEQYHSVTPDIGACIGLWAPSLRVLDQLGLWDAFEPQVKPMFDKISFTQEGGIIHSGSIFAVNEKRYGYQTSMFRRHGILKTLYDSLPERSKQQILVNKKVVALDIKEESVSVRCEDGFEIEGSIIIGADGSHSAVRECTKELARKSFSENEPFGKSEDFKTTYRLLFGNCPRIGDAKPGTVYECHRFGTSTQVFVGDDIMWFFLYEKLDKPTSEHKSYAQKDADEIAARYADHRITKGLHLRDLYKARSASGATDLEEGILDKWWWKRIVLVGDAAHKVTPNAGLGFNSGIQDLAAIANGMRSLQSKGGSLHDNEAIEALFSQYQSQRTKPMRKFGDLSAKTTRICAWHSRTAMIWDRYIMPALNLELIMSRLLVVPIVSNSIVLDWLPEPHYRSGSIAWKTAPNLNLTEEVS